MLPLGRLERHGHTCLRRRRGRLQRLERAEQVDTLDVIELHVAAAGQPVGGGQGIEPARDRSRVGRSRQRLPDPLADVGDGEHAGTLSNKSTNQE